MHESGAVSRQQRSPAAVLKLREYMVGIGRVNHHHAGIGITERRPVIDAAYIRAAIEAGILRTCHVSASALVSGSEVILRRHIGLIQAGPSHLVGLEEHRFAAPLGTCRYSSSGIVRAENAAVRE